MEYLLTEIEGALAADLPLVAVSVALTIPDICGAAEHPNMKTCDRYWDWYTRYIASQIALLTAYDCYRLRCGHIHQGTARHENGAAADPVTGQRFDRVAYFTPGIGDRQDHFTLVGAEGITLHLNARILCEQLIAGARTWLVAKRGDQTVQENLLRMVQVLPPAHYPIRGARRVG